MWKENITVWPWRWRKNFPLKPWYPPTRLHDVKTKTTMICSVFVKFLFQWLWWWENGGSSRKFGRSTKNHQKSSWEVSSTKPPTSCNAVESQNSGTLITDKLEICNDNKQHYWKFTDDHGRWYGTDESRMGFDILYICELHRCSGGPTPFNHLHDRPHPPPKHSTPLF